MRLNGYFLRKSAKLTLPLSISLISILSTYLRMREFKLFYYVLPKPIHFSKI